MATELIKGKSIDELERCFSNKEVLDALGGEEYWRSNLPQKIHCSVLSEEAVLAAIEDYKRRKNIL
jgi:nitrogen fixation NifU-like protein